MKSGTLYEKKGYQILLPITVMIWGSLYVAGRVVMEHMSALFLLFLRFSVSAVLLLELARVKKIGKINREDCGEMFLVGEKMCKRDIISLLIAVAGAVVIIGNPGGNYSVWDLKFYRIISCLVVHNDPY